MAMQLEDAIRLAKTEFQKAFSGEESLYPATLEEVWFDDGEQTWKITLGLRRKLPILLQNQKVQDVLDPLGRRHRPELKVVAIRDADGKLISIKSRELVQAA
jgi:hypothetical protein